MGITLTRTETLSSKELRERLAMDPRQAARTILAAARDGALEAQTLLGQILLDGNGIERDPALARTWFRIAAERGDAMARNMLGRCLEQGWGGEVDLEGAAREYRLALEAGLDWAMYNYAGLLATGRGVARDQHRAFALYLQAAELGHAKSMNLAGRYFEEGIAVEPSLERARDWYRRSALAGDFRGQFSHAAVLAEEGQLDDALHWLHQALDGGNLNFLRASRARLTRAPHPSLRALAAAYYQRAVELGDDSDRQALEAYQSSERATNVSF
ncbi:tetratricopeptide repeat protein [Pseudomonas sp. LFM046]|uniref:tetratricopeptide repeat protein n=1 Tax=Pseudomonas sp. LFM046 TaxID=1608357 RepID=UPI0005CFA6BC|nr:tetratricopeptide repeat protein [Pseudomonas sp. LFM046]